MINFIKNILGKTKKEKNDIVRFIRTEYYMDTRHWKDEDCVVLL